MGKKELILYGLDNYKIVINKIINELKQIDSLIDDFDIRLILTEALTNAFNHGNKKSKDKPIFLRYLLNKNQIIIEVEASGDRSNDELDNITIEDTISEDTILDTQGRGLFLINCIADEMEFKNKCLVIKKNLSNKSLIPC
ncbi:MAG: ATP-binding protein [Vallitalea sp.]|jgi:serine/threonine-protein kinase RsbW|nr:ATP-binding protein [Vallitalea sp.]